MTQGRVRSAGVKLCLTPGKYICHVEMLIQFALVSPGDFVCCRDGGREKACPPEMTSPRLFAMLLLQGGHRCLSHSLLLGGPGGEQGGAELKSQGDVERGQEKPGRSRGAWGEGTSTETGTDSLGPQPTTREAAGGGPIEDLPLNDKKLGSED